MYSIRPIHWNIKSAPASPGRSRAGPAFYVFSFLGMADSSRPRPLPCFTQYVLYICEHFTNFVRELLVKIASSCSCMVWFGGCTQCGYSKCLLCHPPTSPPHMLHSSSINLAHLVANQYFILRVGGDLFYFLYWKFIHKNSSTQQK